MKRSVVIFLVLFISLSVFASPFTSFRPLNREYRAMGEAGMSLTGSEKGFYSNPAALSTDNFSLVLPALEVGVGSFTEIMTIPFSKVAEGDMNAVNDILSKFTGTIPILDVKASSSLNIFGFGTALDVEGGLYTSGEGISVGLIPFVKVGGSVGYGKGFEIKDGMKLEVGGVGHMAMFFYSSPIDVSSLLDSLSKGDFEKISLRYSNTSVTVDLGTTLRFDNGFSLAMALNGIGKGSDGVDFITGEPLDYRSEFSLDFGAGWERVFYKWIGVKTAIDFTDTVGFIKDPSFASFLYHTNMGLKLNLTKGLGFMCGLKGGYPSLGMDLKLWFIDLSVLYTMDEYSDKMGFNPRDALSLLLRLEF